MLFIFIIFLFFTTTLQLFPGGTFSNDGNYHHLYSKVCISIQIFEYNHSFSYYFGLLEEIRYPKDMINIMLFLNADSLTNNNTIFYDLKKY